MIWYSRYFFEAVGYNDYETWIKTDNMLMDYHHVTRDLNEAIAWAKVVSISCGCNVEVLQQEYNLKTLKKEWYCVAAVSGIKTVQ